MLLTARPVRSRVFSMLDAECQLCGTHYRKLFSVVTLLQFLSLRHSSFPRFSLLPLLTNTLPCPSASEVTTLWRCTNLFVVIIIIIIVMSVSVGWYVCPPPHAQSHSSVVHVTCAMAQCFSGSVAIRRVLPVVWMT